MALLHDARISGNQWSCRVVDDQCCHASRIRNLKFFLSSLQMIPLNCYLASFTYLNEVDYLSSRNVRRLGRRREGDNTSEMEPDAEYWQRCRR